MSTPSANLSVLVGKNFACVKIAGRANFTSSPDFKTLLAELSQKGYGHFIIDLSECVLMDSTFLGVLAGLRVKANTLRCAPGGYPIAPLTCQARAGQFLGDCSGVHHFTNHHE